MENKRKLIMRYSEKQIKQTFKKIIDRIEKGESLRSVLRDNDMPSSQTFFKWIDSDEIKTKQYARATELRAEQIFDEMFEIADDSSNDYMEVQTENGKVTKLNKENIQRSRLRIDTRKWALSKMNPKKYGDKLEVENKEKQTIEFVNVSKQYPDK